jgi:glycine cleavage system aminomethyltransferase T
MKEIGFITSAGKSGKSGRVIALGFVRRGFDKSGTALHLCRNNTLIGSAEVRTFPLDQA